MSIMDKISIYIMVGLSIFAIGSVLLVFLLIRVDKRKDKNNLSTNKKVKDKEDRFKALVNIKASKLRIDGKDIFGLNSENGYDVKLWPGEHLIEGVYTVQSISGCNVVNYQTKRMKSRIKLEEGCQYHIELYLYPAKDRESFNPHGNLVCVHEQQVDVVGQKLKAYILCYQDMDYKV